MALLPLSEAPLVSVLVASYNYAEFLPQALDSLQAQRYAAFEAIICDDGSTDASPEIAAAYARRDARFQVIQKANAGVASALNAAFSESRGEIICLLDADDAFRPDKLGHVVEGFRLHPACGLLMHVLQIIDDDGRPGARLPGSVPETGWLADVLCARGGRWRAMPAGGLCFRRPLAEHLFPIPEASFRSEADGFLTTLAPFLTSVAFLPEPLATYRLHGANLTGATKLDADFVARRLDALRRKAQAVNARLAELGITEGIELDRNVNFHEQALALALFEGAPAGHLLRRYARLARALLTDDLYSTARKALGLFAFGAVLFLPRQQRARWLSRLLGGPRLRRLAARLRTKASPRNTDEKL